MRANSVCQFELLHDAIISDSESTIINNDLDFKKHIVQLKDKKFRENASIHVSETLWSRISNLRDTIRTLIHIFLSTLNHTLLYDS